MSSRMVQFSFLVSLALPMLATPGCSWPLNTQFSHPSVHMPVPVPLSPYFQKEQENKFWVRERYQRVPILGPVTSGGPPVALDPPSPDEVVRALERARNVEGGVPLLHEIQRNNVRMVIEPISDYVDPPRVYPLIGPAQLHHAHYKCIVYFSEVTRVGWPIPFTTVDEDAQEVIYIDHNHFHMVGNVDDGPGGNL
jgi:hypothetical protein